MLLTLFLTFKKSYTQDLYKNKSSIGIGVTFLPKSISTTPFKKILQ